MEVEERLHRLEQLVLDARALPLTESALVNRSEVLDIVADVIEALPAELREARWVLEDRERVLERARGEAEALLERAYQERDRLVSETEVVQAAAREADDILAEAIHQARLLRQEADDYVAAKLAGFEDVLRRTLQTIERGRERLAAAADVEGDGDPGSATIDSAVAR
jgi:cell division septum initiation protein DivIVA